MIEHDGARLSCLGALELTAVLDKTFATRDRPEWREISLRGKVALVLRISKPIHMPRPRQRYEVHRNQIARLELKKYSN